jgi:hypothetical protein
MLLDDLSAHLSSNGMTTVIYKGAMQETPNDIVVLRETGGFPSQHVMSAATGHAILEEPTVQVLSRSLAYDAASTVARQALALFDGLRDTTINGVLYHWVTALQPPFLLERDANQRFIIAFNLHVKRVTIP